MDFLKLKDKRFLITGVANKKSVAFHVAKILIESGAQVLFSVQNDANFKKVEGLFPESEIYKCDVEDEEDLRRLSEQLGEKKISGLLHSIAFANYSEGIKPFHETNLKDYLQATNISCFSLVSLANILRKHMSEDASVVTISISNTKATSYGYMGPIKAALDATVPFLAKSFSEFSQIRFNAVCSGPLKTSASAGIPGYVNNFIYSEQLMLRKKALKTEEVANTVAFLLSPRSSGINGEKIVVDGGMSCNYFDQQVVNLLADNI
ncbi:MAG: SDR family oxidoreductase [Bdellovibrionota bacterium]|nr:SDR family oxidoreductase [Bdellovibrionota bacterium]